MPPNTTLPCRDDRVEYWADFLVQLGTVRRRPTDAHTVADAHGRRNAAARSRRRPLVSLPRSARARVVRCRPRGGVGRARRRGRGRLVRGNACPRGRRHAARTRGTRGGRDRAGGGSTHRPAGVEPASILGRGGGARDAAAGLPGRRTAPARRRRRWPCRGAPPVRRRPCRRLAVRRDPRPHRPRRRRRRTSTGRGGRPAAAGHRAQFDGGGRAGGRGGGGALPAAARRGRGRAAADRGGLAIAGRRDRGGPRRPRGGGRHPAQRRAD